MVFEATAWTFRFRTDPAAELRGFGSESLINFLFRHRPGGRISSGFSLRRFRSDSLNFRSPFPRPTFPLSPPPPCPFALLSPPAPFEKSFFSPARDGRWFHRPSHIVQIAPVIFGCRSNLDPPVTTKGSVSSRSRMCGRPQLRSTDRLHLHSSTTREPQPRPRKAQSK
jgi:hypothetical protein